LSVASIYNSTFFTLVKRTKGSEMS